jgi:hypothetical protein
MLPLALAAFVACGDDEGNNPTGGSFTLGAPASTQVSLQAGQATTVTIPVTFTGNMSPVTLRADSVPAGVRVGFQPATITNGTNVVTVSIVADPAATAKTGTVKIIATAPGMTTPQVTRIAVTTTVPPSYTVTNSAATNAVAIQRTQSGTVTITLDRSGGFTGPVDIIPDALPAGVSVASVMGVTGNTATLTINTAANAQAVAGSFTVRLVNPGMIDRTTVVKYSIIAEPGVQVAAADRSVLQSSPDTMFVTVNREGGFTGAVTVTLTNLPAGVTAAPVTSAAGTTVAVPLNITDAAAVGAKQITASVSGTGIATKTATPTLTVRSNLLTSGTGITIASSRARNTIDVYRVVVPTGATSLTVTLAGGTGDADVEIYTESFFESLSSNISCTCS